MKNFFMTLAFYISFLISIIFAQAMHAAPLMYSDDANIVSANQCQLELDHSWKRHATTTLNLTPACNFGADLEWSLPLSWEDGQSSYAVQAKKLWIEFENIPLQLATSVQWQPNQGEQAQQWQVVLPLSYQPTEKWHVDGNLGWQRTQHNVMTWGVISHYHLNSAHHLSIEVFSPEKSQFQAQAIYEYQLIPDQVSSFVSYGQSLSSSATPWVGVGLSFASAF